MSLYNDIWVISHEGERYEKLFDHPDEERFRVIITDDDYDYIEDEKLIYELDKVFTTSYCNIIKHICGEELERMKEFIQSIESNWFCPENDQHLLGQENFIPTFYQVIAKINVQEISFALTDLAANDEPQYEKLVESLRETLVFT